MANPTDSVFNDLKVYPLIMCGGSGTRLWPLSRKARPKQFLTLDGSGKSLLQSAVGRVERMAPAARRWIITTADQESLVSQQCGSQVGRIITEPAARNTGPAVAYAASQLLRTDPDSYMVILSSDHAIQNVRSFESSIADALALARKGLFVTIGVEPTEPSTGFGYIECGLPLDEDGQIMAVRKAQEATGNNLAFAVRSFREKPSKQAAEQFLRTGKYKWNAGIFVWKTSTFWNAFSHIQPEMAAAFENMKDGDVAKVYESLESIPIDVAFMEQTSHVACVPARFDWNDVGSWQAVRNCFEQNEMGNALTGDVIAIDTTNSLVHSSGQTVAVVGLDNIAVVATPDAILVLPLDRSQDVKRIIAEIESRKKLSLL
jgi:mannose-1-phosphate guanylyltransferase/mannose-6-phosphate isomerase